MFERRAGNDSGNFQLLGKPYNKCQENKASTMKMTHTGYARNAETLL